MKHNQVWTKDLGTDMYPADVKSDKCVVSQNLVV